MNLTWKKLILLNLENQPSHSFAKIVHTHDKGYIIVKQPKLVPKANKPKNMPKVTLFAFYFKIYYTTIIYK